jgi:hypothetical protein
MAKVVPPGPVSTSSSVPPWPRTISAAMARPRPEPALARAAVERLEQVIERLFRQAGPGVATSIRQPPSRSDPDDADLARLARGRDGLARVAHEVRQHAVQLFGIGAQHEVRRAPRRSR